MGEAPFPLASDLLHCHLSASADPFSSSTDAYVFSADRSAPSSHRSWTLPQGSTRRAHAVPGVLRGRHYVPRPSATGAHRWCPGPRAEHSATRLPRARRNSLTRRALSDAQTLIMAYPKPDTRRRIALRLWGLGALCCVALIGRVALLIAWAQATASTASPPFAPPHLDGVETQSDPVRLVAATGSGAGLLRRLLCSRSRSYVARRWRVPARPASWSPAS